MGDRSPHMVDASFMLATRCGWQWPPVFDVVAQVAAGVVLPPVSLHLAAIIERPLSSGDLHRHAG